MSKMSKTLRARCVCGQEIELLEERSDMNYLWLRTKGLEVRMGVGDRVDPRLLVPFCDSIAVRMKMGRHIILRQVVDWLRGQKLWDSEIDDLLAFKSWLASSDKAGMDVNSNKRLSKSNDQIRLSGRQVGRISNGILIFDQNVTLSKFAEIKAGCFAIKGKLISKQ